MVSTVAYERLLSLLGDAKAKYRVIDHAPEGQTDLVSQLRGHGPEVAAKCMILMMKLGKKVTKFILAVIPGDRRVDFDKLRSLFGATFVAFASPQDAARLGGSEVGTILPFSWEESMELIVDKSLLQIEEMFFNAGRLDRSIALNTRDYFEITKPRTEVISR